MHASIIYNALTVVVPLQLEMNSNAMKISYQGGKGFEIYKWIV